MNWIKQNYQKVVFRFLVFFTYIVLMVLYLLKWHWEKITILDLMFYILIACISAVLIEYSKYRYQIKKQKKENKEEIRKENNQ